MLLFTFFVFASNNSVIPTTEFGLITTELFVLELVNFKPFVLSKLIPSGKLIWS